MHTFEMFTLDKDISMQISAIEHFDGLSEFNIPNVEKRPFPEFSHFYVRTLAPS